MNNVTKDVSLIKVKTIRAKHVDEIPTVTLEDIPDVSSLEIDIVGCYGIWAIFTFQQRVLKMEATDYFVDIFQYVPILKMVKTTKN